MLLHPVLESMPCCGMQHVKQYANLHIMAGLAMHYGEIRVWGQIVHRSRRFFAPGAAEEIWAEFSPALGNIFTPQFLEVSHEVGHCLLSG